MLILVRNLFILAQLAVILYIISNKTIKKKEKDVLIIAICAFSVFVFIQITQVQNIITAQNADTRKMLHDNPILYTPQP